MSIRCVCPNGHVLHVKESLAGTTGLCPSCKGRVNVPKPRESRMTEDAILDLLGDIGPSSRSAAGESGIFLSTSDSGVYGQPLAKKTCNRCSREVTTGTHICPYCHTYIASLADF
jgi:hypothetical protein